MLPLELSQIVLLTIIIILTLFLVVLGFQVFFVLKDLRITLKRMNSLFDDANELVDDVRKPIEKAGNFFTALTAGAGLVHLLKKGAKNERSREK